MRYLRETFFKHAIEAAKAMVRRADEEEISVGFLLAGIVTAAQRSDCPSEVKSRLVQLRQKTESVPPLETEPPEDSKKLPLSNALRKIIKETDNWDDLLSRLLAAREVLDLKEVVAYQRIIRRAATCPDSRAEGMIDGEAFAAAAYCALAAGDLREWPGLSAHLALNKANVEALMAARGWGGADFNPSDSTLELSDDLRRIALEDASPHTKLLRIINTGISSGKDILDEVAIATHEAGHAVVSFALRPEVPVIEVSVIPSGDSLGYMRPDASSPALAVVTPKASLIDACICLAGGIASAIRFGADNIDDGWRSDRERATRIIWEMVALRGHDPEFGPISFEWVSKALDGEPLLYESLRRTQAILKKLQNEVELVLRDQWTHVVLLADKLAHTKVLEWEQVLETLRVDTLAGWQHVKRIRPKRQTASDQVVRTVEFARSAGVIQTREGPQQHDINDAIVSDSDGNKWPVKQMKFIRLYEPLPPTKNGEPGLYVKRTIDFLAIEMKASRHVLSQTGIFKGNQGDWIVDYGDGDCAVVGGSIFDVTYDVLGEANEDQF